MISAAHKRGAITSDPRVLLGVVIIPLSVREREKSEIDTTLLLPYTPLFPFFGTSANISVRAA